MVGTLVNTAAIITGSYIGLIFKSSIMLASGLGVGMFFSSVENKENRNN
jgi:uncharacterized membrane protein YqgA involved in biofilm formation